MFVYSINDKVFSNLIRFTTHDSLHLIYTNLTAQDFQKELADLQLIPIINESSKEYFKLS